MIQVLLLNKAGQKLFSSVADSKNKTVIVLKDKTLGITGEFFTNKGTDEACVRYVFDSIAKIASYLDVKNLSDPKNNIYYFALKSVTSKLDYNAFKKEAEQEEKDRIESKLDKEFLLFK